MLFGARGGDLDAVALGARGGDRDWLLLLLVLDVVRGCCRGGGERDLLLAFTGVFGTESGRGLLAGPLPSRAASEFAGGCGCGLFEGFFCSVRFFSASALSRLMNESNDTPLFDGTSLSPSTGDCFRDGFIPSLSDKLAPGLGLLGGSCFCFFGPAPRRLARS